MTNAPALEYSYGQVTEPAPDEPPVVDPQAVAPPGSCECVHVDPLGGPVRPGEYPPGTFGGGPPRPLATGATAGTPGSFTPPGSKAPTDLAEMQGITASPTTAWTTSQYVALDPIGSAYWTGTAWALGVAP
jgi:hypothetical protein